MGEVSCYDMHLYCDNEEQDWPDGHHGWQEFPHEMTGRTRGECVKEARSMGWVFHRNRKLSCPKCSGGKKS